MGRLWYIDRGANISTILKKEYFQKLKTMEGSLKSDDLINFLEVGSAGNPNAVLTNLRDLGLIKLVKQNNELTDFFKVCIKSNLSIENICLLILMKRNSLKEEANTIKPFVVIAKALALMIKAGNEPKLTWTICAKHLMGVNDYESINERLIAEAVADTTESENEGVLDIWFNALLFTGLFEGDKNSVTLKRDYYAFIDFIANYGQEMLPCKHREDYVYQASSAKYGLYLLTERHSFEAIIALSNLPELYVYLNETKAYDEPNELRIAGGENVLLYGVPGAGKSHEIKTHYCNNSQFMERVVFHPDYTYSDFIGQILPTTDEKDRIRYQFSEGPFTSILNKAIHDPNNMYYLVIEEINRGNAPAIFGEIFQLLDRTNGESEYGITNFEIAKFIYGNKTTEIKIPSNLTLLATMNTADQNVFTLDTAFKRRWSLRSIKNDIAHCKHAGDLICGTTVSWQQFAETINEKIIEFGKDNLSSEDNRLGAYFVQADDLASPELFGEKVLMYLWNDAFKYNKEDIFSNEYRTLEELIEGFNKYRFAIFDSSLGFPTLEEMKLEKSELSDSEYLFGKPEWQTSIYNSIKTSIIERVDEFYSYTTGSKQYIGLGSKKNQKRSFADVSFQKEQVVLYIEKPKDETLLDLGTELQIDNHHNHYYRINIAQDMDLERIISAIIDSYEQLKKEE